MISLTNEQLFTILREKATLKQTVYHNTLETFTLLKTIVNELAEEYAKKDDPDSSSAPFLFHDRGKFEFELRFGGDILLFMMHTNVFEFSRNHEVMKTPYITQDKARSYCGIINIFNFLSDSFKYHRVNDVGYLIGRAFINKEKHYFIEGKREIGQLYNNFETSVISPESATEIIRQAILYTINFDLLTPPYDNVKQVSVYEIQATLDSMQLKTGKRLGYRFQGDHKEFKASTKE